MAELTAKGLEAAYALLQSASDGDVIRLEWPGVTPFLKSAVESRAMAFGLDVVVEIVPQKEMPNVA